MAGELIAATAARVLAKPATVTFGSETRFPTLSEA